MRVVLLSWGLGCATPAPEIAPDPPPPIAERPPEKKRPLRVKELAARMRDDIECEQAVVNLEKRSPKVAWALLRACVDQDKFRNLRRLLDAPWRKQLEAMKEWDRHRLLGHVVAIRGADFDTDLRLLGAAGFEISALRAAIDRPSDFRAKPVIFRGYVRSRRLEKDGAIAMVIGEVGRYTVDKKVEYLGELYKYGSVEGRALTGVEVETRVGPLPMLVREGNEFVFLALVRSIRKSVPQVEIVDVYRRGVILLD
jgi:hypothetical protein